MEDFSPRKFSVTVLEEGSRGPTVENKWHGFPLDSALSRSIHRIYGLIAVGQLSSMCPLGRSVVFK